MNTESIVIQTEVVTYDKMTSKERQIYDTAYQRGMDDAVSQSKGTSFMIGLFTGWFIGFLLFKLLNW